MPKQPRMHTGSGVTLVPTMPGPGTGSKEAGRCDYDLVHPDNWPEWVRNMDTEHGAVQMVNGEVIWVGGTIHDGIWMGGLFLNGRFRDGIWMAGTMKNGIWSHGEFYSGEICRSVIWQDGTFFNGDFYGYWEDGVFEGGNFYGTWCGGVWRHGEFRGVELRPRLISSDCK